MGDIWDAAIARGMVIEGSRLFVKALAPIVEHGLTTIHSAADPITAIQKENEWRRNNRKGDPLGKNIAAWGLNDLQKMLNVHWFAPRGTPCFYNFFRDTLHVVSTDSLKSELESARAARDCAAHPEFLLLEDGQGFFRSAQRVLTLLGQTETAKQFQDYLSELTAMTLAGVRNMAVLNDRYPDEYENDFDEAEQVWITGTNLRRIVTDRKLAQVNNVLRKKNGSVKILMHRPRDPVCKYAMLQEGLGPDQLPQYAVDVRDNLLEFFKIREDAAIGHKMEIKTIDYMFTFGLDVMNGTRHDATSAVYLRLYPLPRAGIKKVGDQPMIKFRHTDPRWYDFFVDQFTYHWEHEAAEELAPDWDPRGELSFLKLS